MMPSVFHVTLTSTVITWVVVLLTSTQLASGMMVHLNYTSPNATGQPIPDDVNITLNTGPGSLTHLHLKRVEDLNPNVPIFTLNVGPDGKYVYKKENLKDKKNIGYYQDVANEAVIQITRTNGLGEKKAQLVLKGELNVAGHKYTLRHESRVKRDTSSSTTSTSSPSPSSSSSSSSSDDDEPYNLLPQAVRPAELHDYVPAPPEVKVGVKLASRPDIPVSINIEPLSLSSSSLSSSSSSSSPSSSQSGGRSRRQAVTTYYVDCVAVADYGAYRRFLNEASSRTAALQEMREYYAFIYNGVDLRYQTITSTNYRIRVRLTKIIVTETTTASSFTELYRVTNKPWDEVSAQSVLTAFSEFAAGSGGEILSPYDHAMLFTGYDLTSDLSTGGTTNATTGLAYTSTLCRTDGKAVSVVEDLGGFQCVDTAAHELGHGLSARHDGDGNTCRSTDRYIMAGGSSPETEANKYNPWLFSPCSISAFTSFITSQMRTLRGQTCLGNPLPINSAVPDVSGRLPGQEYPPDEQCRMIYGDASRLCRGTEFGDSSNICTSMFCFDPTTDGTCYEQTAARGTTCGNGKLCLNGQCVSDTRAPSVDENCVFGDQPGVAFDGMTCAEFVSGFKGYCYQALVRGRCCESCKDAYTPVKNCEYGDTVRGCSSGVCSFATTRYLEQCCGTCNYGSTFMPGTTTTGTNRITSGPKTTTITTTEVDSDTCVDNPNAQVNQMSCQNAVSMYPRFCYQDDVRTACCASCKQINSGVADCEYGDKYPTSCSQIVSCEGLTDECCHTCRDRSAELTNPPASPTETPQCQDSLNKLVNGLTCSQAISVDSSLCYQSSVQDSCCSSCKAVYSGVRGCEYGDRIPTLCKSQSSCRNVTTNDCCSTCGNGDGSGSSSLSHRNLAELLTPCLIGFATVYAVTSSLLTRALLHL